MTQLGEFSRQDSPRSVVKKHEKFQKVFLFLSSIRSSHNQYFDYAAIIMRYLCASMSPAISSPDVILCD